MDKVELDGVRPSIGTGGDAHDNSRMETEIGLLKTEGDRISVSHGGTHGGTHEPIANATLTTVQWLDRYHKRWLDSTLEIMTKSQDAEDAHYAALNRELQPVEERQRT